MPKPALKTQTAFGLWLDDLMEAECIDQKGVASKIGVTQPVISKWRRGEPRPTHDDVIKIIRAFRPERINEELFKAGFTPDGHRPELERIPDSQENRIYAAYNNADPKTKRIVKVALGLDDEETVDIPYERIEPGKMIRDYSKDVEPD